MHIMFKKARKRKPTLNSELVVAGRDLELDPSSALCVVAAAQVWHALLTSLVDVHITRCCQTKKQTTL